MLLEGIYGVASLQDNSDTRYAYLMIKTNQKHLLNKRQVAEYLGFKVCTVDAWVCQRRIPYIKVGGRCVRFDPDEIEVWLKEQTVEPAPL